MYVLVALNPAPLLIKCTELFCFKFLGRVLILKLFKMELESNHTIKSNREQIDLILKGVIELEDTVSILKVKFWIVFVICFMLLGAIIQLSTCKKSQYKSTDYSSQNTNCYTNYNLLNSGHSLKHVFLE